ncbi:MAG: helix-turn-helix domain-containing protein [Planctomycetes bacterium]|nr:helix-turn-helix domain-containing protein [Planctomycetota bacterium]
MLNAEQRDTIMVLHRMGESVRSIAGRLACNRKTVARVIDTGGAPTQRRPQDLPQLDEERLRALHAECGGWMQRMHEKLTEEQGVCIAYSTLTQRCRELGLARKTSKTSRSWHVETEPGEEMQHDTSPYTVRLGKDSVKVVASILYLRYSKVRYLRFYLRFRRYEMKCFLHEALMHFGCCAQVCIIDNTNLARLCGSGAGATIHPEMEAFSRRYGYSFLCHEIGHSDRKAGNERSFWTTETNFLPGRTFTSLSDLNAQALKWATVRLPRRPHSKSRVIPAELFEVERNHLLPIAPDFPGPMRYLPRKVDAYGCVELDSNSFWVPGERRGQVQVVEHPGHFEIYQGCELLMSYPKPAQDVRRTRFDPEGVDTRPPRRMRTRPTRMEEDELRALGRAAADYLDFILTEAKGVRASNLIRLVHGLSRQIGSELFLRTIERALLYRITDIAVIENIAGILLGEAGWRSPRHEIDPDLERREAYLEGGVSPAPNLDAYNFDEEDESC